MSKSDLPPVAGELLARRAAFTRFVRARVGNDADAEDIVQAGLARALNRAGALRDEARLVAWFYQLLRHAIVDHARTRKAAQQREQTWAGDPALSPEPTASDERELCRCFEPLIAGMKPQPAALLRAVELENRSVRDVAAELGLTANHASVLLHRARAELRRQLEILCGDCAAGACLDCDCPPASGIPASAPVQSSPAASRP